jgi:transposase
VGADCTGGSLKAFRRIATRYEKTDACFAGLLNLVASFLASR